MKLILLVKSKNFLLGIIYCKKIFHEGDYLFKVVSLKNLENLESLGKNLDQGKHEQVREFYWKSLKILSWQQLIVKFLMLGKPLEILFQEMCRLDSSIFGRVSNHTFLTLHNFLSYYIVLVSLTTWIMFFGLTDFTVYWHTSTYDI